MSESKEPGAGQASVAAEPGGFAVLPGGPNSSGVLFLLAGSPAELTLAVKVGEMWSASFDPDRKPWLCFASSPAAEDATWLFLHQLALTSAGQDAVEPDHRWPKLAGAPLRARQITVVSFADTRRESVHIVTDPPALGGDLPYAVKRELEMAGQTCIIQPMDDSALFVDVSYASGEMSREQVIGWEDLYPNGELDDFDSYAILHLRVAHTLVKKRSEILTVLAQACESARSKTALEAAPRDEARSAVDPIDPRTDMITHESRTKGRCPSSGENVGQMIEWPGSDEWNIRCPTCGATWAGGGTLLEEHERYR